MKQVRLVLGHDLIIDNFAGGGGASTGIKAVIGRDVDIAINHDPEAVAMHTANHPDTHHYCEDVFAVDPIKVTQGQPVQLAWFSPDCKHFSKAKGGKPVSKKIRGLAWVVVKYANLPKASKPKVIMLENVKEFETWGPLRQQCWPNGDPMFDLHGKPVMEPNPSKKGKTFKRWVRELKKAGYAVEWRSLKACDYGAPTIRDRLYLIARCDGQPIVWPKPTHGKGLLPYRTAAECIDFSIPCPSIFDRKKPLAENTLKRIAKGLKRYVIDSADPFIVSVAHGEESPRGVKRWGAGIRETDKPLPTVLASGNSSALVTPYIARIGQTGGGDSYSKDARDPLTTVTSKAEHLLIAPTLVQTGYGEREGQAPRALDIEAPLGTVVGSAKHALVSAFLAKHYTGVIGSDLTEQLGTVTSVDHHSLVTANLVHYHADKRDADVRASDVREPLKTQTTENRHAIVTSNLVKLRGDNVGQLIDAPLATVSAQGTHHAEVRAFLLKYYGNEKDGCDLGEPIHTVTSKERFGLVTIHGVDYQIVDIGMRMLTPRELYLAQGFPADYVIDYIYEYAKNRKNGTGGRIPLTKTSQVRMCGNSVCPPVATALVKANIGVRAKNRKAA